MRQTGRIDIDVSAVILPGRENARTGRELARLLNCAPRDITILVECERRAGAPILASCSNKQPGYYLAETPGEIESYCDALKKRAGEIFKTRRALLDTAAKMYDMKAKEEAAAAATASTKEEKPINPVQLRLF